MFGELMKGPLKPYAAGFYADVISQGYAPGSAANHVWLMACLSAWMAEVRLGPGELTQENVDLFLAERRSRNQRLPAAIAPLLRHLRRLGAAPEPPPVLPITTERDRLLQEYRTYLSKERGLASSTRDAYLRVAGLFLSEADTDNGSVKRLGAAEVSAFVLKETRKRRTGSAKEIARGMRSLLRFLHVAGEISAPLDHVVPGVANWRLAALPKAVQPTEIDQLLASCDQSTPVGRRDRAIITILARLGLRAHEVAALRLRDVDWRHGEIIIHGKGSCTERLPLPVDVGEAIVAWLMQSRPTASASYVFTRVRAPHHGLTRMAISDIVHAACVRAGLPPFRAHRLRHSVATQMLRNGADLIEIGQVLRHRSLETTAIYAKVDRTSLSSLARPWPGGAL